MKIYVTYKFLTKEDRDAFYKSNQRIPCPESLSSGKGMSQVFLYTSDTVLFKKNGHLKTYGFKTFNSALYGLVEGIKTTIFSCQTTVRHGSAC